MLLSALAGPVSNLILGYLCYVISFCIHRFSFMYELKIPYGSYIGVKLSWLNSFDYIFMAVYLLFFIGYIMNVGLAVFNLLPVPPLDGSRILFGVLPDRYYFGVMKYERYISIVIMVLLVTGALSTPLTIVRNLIGNLFELTLSWMV